MLRSAAVIVAIVALAAWSFLPKSFDVFPSPDNPSETMAAVVYSEHGNSSVLKYTTDHAKPLLRGNQILIRVHAAALNPCDFKFRRNYAPSFVRPLPKIPGEDIAGVVADAGSSSRFKVGDRVAAMMPILGSKWGAYAEFVAVDESFCAPIPASMPDTSETFEGAASLPLVALTAVQAFNSIGKPEAQLAGKKILIHAGAGGVGTFAIQWAKQVLKMHVATTASVAKEPLVKSLGADLVIDYRSTNFEEVVKGYDYVFDLMSFTYESRTLSSTSEVLKDSGHYLNILSSDWSLSSTGLEVANGLTSWTNVVYYKIAHALGRGPGYSLVAVEPNGAQLTRVLELVAQGDIRPVVDSTRPLQEAAAAHAYLEQGTAAGKVVLQVAS